jgi:hypothetical protein
MSVRWFMGIALLWTMLTLISGLVTGTFFDASAPTIIDFAMNPTMLTASSTNLALGQIQGITINPAFWTAVWSALWFDYPFFSGFYIIFRWLFCSLTVGFLWGILQTTVSAVQRIF